MIATEFFQEMESEIDQSKSITDIGSLITAVSEIKKEKVTSFRRELENKTLATDIDAQVDQFSEKIDHHTTKFLQNRLNASLKSFQNQKYKKMESIINGIFSSLDVNFWESSMKFYHKEIDNYSDDLGALFKNAPQMKAELCSQEMIDQMKVELHIFIKSYLKVRFRRFDSYILDKFKREFLNTPTGMRRNWKTIEEAEITEFYTVA